MGKRPRGAMGLICTFYCYCPWELQCGSLEFLALLWLTVGRAGTKKSKWGFPGCYLNLVVMLFSLIFLKPNIERLDFFDLMWIVGITDFVLKYLTIALKCLIVALPKIILAVKSKVRASSLLDAWMCIFDNLVSLHVYGRKYGWKGRNRKTSDKTLAELPGQ